MLDNTVVIHNVDTQTVVQELPSSSFPSSPTGLVACPGGLSVPSTQRAQKLRPKSIKLLRCQGAIPQTTMAEVEVENFALPDEGTLGELEAL